MKFRTREYESDNCIIGCIIGCFMGCRIKNERGVSRMEVARGRGRPPHLAGWRMLSRGRR